MKKDPRSPWAWKTTQAKVRAAEERWLEATAHIALTPEQKLLRQAILETRARRKPESELLSAATSETTGSIKPS